MPKKFPYLVEKNSDINEINSALELIYNQIDTLKNHSFNLPFESEPSEFLKDLSVWQSKNKQ
tara:strand:- start:599 stop:784 length:186 start_codon:yes stop_codon:yes gene_type:complete